MSSKTVDEFVSKKIDFASQALDQASQALGSNAPNSLATASKAINSLSRDVATKD